MRRGRFSVLALKDDGVEQCLRSCGSEFQLWDSKQEKARKPWLWCLYCWIFSTRVSEEERSVIIMKCFESVNVGTVGDSKISCTHVATSQAQN